MKRLLAYSVLSLSFISGLAEADNTLCANNLSIITYPLTVQTTIQAQKAKVSVALNATVNPEQLNSIQATAVSTLQTAVNADWRIESYNQSKTDSGLIDVTMSLQARLDSQQLADLTSKLKSLNSNGQQYAIDNTSYEPTTAEIQHALAKLRLNLLAEAAQQLKEINKTLNSNYELYKVDFNPNNISGAQVKFGVMMAALGNTADNSVSNLAVSQDLSLTADVEFASKNADLSK